MEEVEDCFNCLSITGLYVIILRFVDNLKYTVENENYETGKGKCETEAWDCGTMPV